MNNSERIQAVIDTLQMLQMPTTYDNMSRLLGSLQALAEIRDNIKEKTGEVEEDVHSQQ